jgi:plastocyanin
MKRSDGRTKTMIAVVTAATLAVAAGAAGVGGSATAATAAPATTPSAVDPRAGGFEVALGEWSVTLEAKAIRPGPVTFVISNRGKVAHGFELEIDGDDHGGHHGDEEDVETRTLRPGETVRLTVNLQPGSYEFECFVGHHDDMGMRGTFSVRADAPLLAPPAASKGAVAIKGFAFRPAVLRVKAGTTVRWRNSDPAPHTVTANSRAFDSRTMAQGAPYARRFARPGTYTYLCALHPQMTGKVIVR